LRLLTKEEINEIAGGNILFGPLPVIASQIDTGSTSSGGGSYSDNVDACFNVMYHAPSAGQSGAGESFAQLGTLAYCMLYGHEGDY
jgi:hypothetical protein